MIAILAFALQAASPPAAVAPSQAVPPSGASPIASSPDGPQGQLQAMAEAKVPRGTLYVTWSEESRRTFAEVAVEAIRLNPSFRDCAALDAAALAHAFDRHARQGPSDPTIVSMAMALYEVCPIIPE